MKSGLDWMPLEVHPDLRWELVESEYGPVGFAVVVKLMQAVYGGKGYYLEWNGETALLFARKAGIGRELAEAIVECAVRRKLFDAEVYARAGVLTSAEIQRQFQSAARRRKETEMNPEWMLIGERKGDEEAAKQADDGRQEEKDGKSGKKDGKFPQRKGEERKEEESRGRRGKKRSAVSAARPDRQAGSAGGEDAPSPTHQREEFPTADREERESKRMPPGPAVPTRASLEERYGKENADEYLAKAARYRLRGEKALRKAAQWLAEDRASGKLSDPSSPPRRPPSFDLEDFTQAVRAPTPVYEGAAAGR